MNPIVIEEQFRGPPQSGNGGYVGGVFASHLPATPGKEDNDAVQVTLRAPTPLDKPLTAVPVDSDHLKITDGEVLIAEVERTTLDMDIPAPPTFERALAAQEASPSFFANINPLLPEGTGFHPVCFCCGADVAEQKGLRVFAAPVDGFDGVAAAWQPYPAFAGEAGMLPPAIIWAALDCPGQFAYLCAGIRTGMLGRMTTRLLQPVSACDRCVITGWCMEVEGKKHFAGTALFNQAGECCAFSKQVWIGRPDWADKTT